MRTLNLTEVPLGLHERVRQAYEERDALGFVITVSNTAALALVFDNLFALREVGIYEAALLHALTGTRTNHAHWSFQSLRLMLDYADPARLRAAGDPLPGPGPFRLFRGVAGEGGRRKVRGLHWTSSARTATWFAKRFALPDPAVYVVDVPASAVLAYVADRGETDYIVMLPPRIRPERLVELPEAAAPSVESDTCARPVFERPPNGRCGSGSAPVPTLRKRRRRLAFGTD